MPTDVIMPTLGLTMEEGTITEWLKREGEAVDKEEPLFIVETDKAAMEVPSPASGVLQRIIAQAGATVAVRQPIAVIAEPGEVEAAEGGQPGAGEGPGEAPGPAQPLQPLAAEPAAAQAAQAAGSPGQAGAVAAGQPAAAAPAESRAASDLLAPPQAGARLRISPAARRVAGELGVEVGNLRGSGPEGRIVERDVRAAAQAGALPGKPVAAAPAPAATAERVVASPLARKLAAEHGVDLATLRGSGPGGRIVEKDVLDATAPSEPVPVPPAQPLQPAAAEPAVAQPVAAPTGPPPAPAEARPPQPTVSPPEPALIPAEGLETVPLGRLRRITAERMAASARAVARVTLFMSVDMSEAVRFRSQLAPEFERRYGARLGYDAMIAKAAALALRDHPELNAQWAEGAVRPISEVNVGTAVALDDGLLVVVVRQTDARPLHEVQSELLGLFEKARAKRLGPDDVSGSTFTITNLGSYGVEAFTPIVNLPEAAILGVGRIARQPAVIDEELAIRDQMTLSLAFDHRVADGAPAARLLQRLKDILEAPYILLT